MGCDRRRVLGALIAVGLLPGCAKATVPPSVSPSPWASFAARFALPDGRIVDDGNGGISHSEGQGYGMLLAEAAGDRAAFDRLWGWTDRTLARKDVRLFSWRFDPRQNPAVADPNNATDGDILIAWALMRAAVRWKEPGYASASSAIRAAIRSRLVWKVAGLTILLPGLDGFVEPKATTLNLSYYVWPALDAFRNADGEAAWGALIGDGQRLLADARFGAMHLPPDWIELDAGGASAPARNRPARFGFDAIRIPLYLAWSDRRAALAPYRAFWQGYLRERRPIPAWIDVVSGETAPFAVSNGGMAVVALTVHQPAPVQPPAPADYYSAVLTALARLAA